MDRRSRASHKKRQSTKGGLSFRLPKFNSKSNKRAYYRKIWFSRYTLITITQRRFKTPDRFHNRPGRRLLRLPFGPIKEISFDIKRYQKRQQPCYPQMPLSSLTVSLLILALGLNGIYYFSSRAQSQPADIYISPAAYALNPQVDEHEPSSATKFYDRARPLRIIAPSINLDAPITIVYKEDDDTLGTPPYTEDIAGWYKQGPSPGEVGPAIINGHVGTYRGPSVFWDLHKFKPGDIISIEREDKTTVRFKVNIVDQYEIDNFPTKKVYGDINHAGLRLITCGGTFDKSSKRYSHNTVVYARMVSVPEITP